MKNLKKFMAIKINYDHREYLPAHLKYSTPATSTEYKKYIKQYKNQGIGGYGFHECMNFQKLKNTDDIYVYLPPGYFPSLSSIDNGNLCIFSFTYEGDTVLGSHIVGVHGLCNVVEAKEGVERSDIKTPAGIDTFLYHATANASYSTIFCEPIPYDLSEYRHLPRFKNNTWKQSRRYLDENHAKNILIDSYYKAQNSYKNSPQTTKIVIDEQLAITERLHSYYFNEKIPASTKTKRKKKKKGFSGGYTLPDKELGQLGEQIVFEAEQKMAQKNKIPLNKLEWVSQCVPHSHFDIKTVRKMGKREVSFMLEVKTTILDNFSNVHISNEQLQLAENEKKSFKFVFVKIKNIKNKIADITEYTVSELKEKFSLVPRSFKLDPK